MGRKSSRRAGISTNPKSKAPPGAQIEKIQNYEDTMEEGGVDDFMFKRERIMFNPQDESDEDINADQGEDVLGLNLPGNDSYVEEDEDDDYSEEEVALKKRKSKMKPDLTAKGRFGRPVPTSDDEASSSGSEDEDEERWGRSYYSRPSNRREKETGEFDETREEEREMEEKEVRRLQRKARENMGGAEDWGLDEGQLQEPATAVKPEAAPIPVSNPTTSDPTTLLRHLEAHEPVKLALARDFPLIVHKLMKTSRGITQMMEEETGKESLHKGLGWLHYQTLLTYATTLTFYLHLCALPLASRPDFSSHPILPRLLQLKEGVNMLEELDFAAGSDSEGEPVITMTWAEGEEEEEEEEGEEGEDEEMSETERRELVGLLQGEGIEEDDGDDLWQKEGLEDGELRDLMADAENGEINDFGIVPRADKEKKKRRGRGKKEKATATVQVNSSKGSYAPLTEPAFFASTSKRPPAALESYEDDDTLGDPTSLNEADASDKERRKRSLRFHTSKIAATSARRNAARTQRLGGDEDLPYRDRKAARDAALRKNGPQGDGGEALEPVVERKRARDVIDDGDDTGDGVDDGEGYYDLVKRRRKEEKAAKEAEHEAVQTARFAAFDDDTQTAGPRALTRAIEKNRGLTPRRSKTGRNPRVKKRQAYEKAKQKVASQRAVFKGGQASLGGAYRGEKTGISTTVKSGRF